MHQENYPFMKQHFDFEMLKLPGVGDSILNKKDNRNHGDYGCLYKLILTCIFYKSTAINCLVSFAAAAVARVPSFVFPFAP